MLPDDGRHRKHTANCQLWDLSKNYIGFAFFGISDRSHPQQNLWNMARFFPLPILLSFFQSTWLSSLLSVLNVFRYDANGMTVSKESIKELQKEYIQIKVP